MARIRSIKPEFWDDEKLASLPRDVRLLYIGMWNFSDDFGVVKSNPVWLKSKVFPFDEIQLSQFKKWLEMLERPGFNSPSASLAWVIPFQASGEGFYYLPKFSRHQRVEKPSTFNRNPEPPKAILDWKPTITDSLPEGSPTPPRGLPSVLGEVKGEGEVKGKGEGAAREFFDEARKSFPGTKKGIGPEWENFKKKFPNYTNILPLLAPAIEREIAHRAKLAATPGAFLPSWKNFGTWINGECWTQEFGEVTAVAPKIGFGAPPATRQQLEQTMDAVIARAKGNTLGL